MELQIPTLEQLRSVYSADLEESFPPAELKPLWAIETLWEDGFYRPWCLFDGGKIVGECFLWLGEPGWALLDYLCVSPRYRNGGTGAVLLEKMRAGNADLTILGECEIPEFAPDPALAERRLGFYHRNGAKLATYDTAMFGVPYKTIYWAEGPLADEELMARHRWIYQSRFSPEKYGKHIRIPWSAGMYPLPRIPWEE